MKKLLLSVMLLGVALSLAQPAHAFRPSGWVYHDYPWVYDSGSGDWHWFNPGDTQWVAHMGSGSWAVLPESALASGWVYYLWPFAYAQGSDAWHWINEPDTQWVANMRNGRWWRWSRFGDPVADPDPDPDREGMVLIPGGTRSGENPLTPDESHDGWYPATYDITVDSFYMDPYPVTKALWDEVYNWATHPDRGANVYSFDNAGSGKAADHPVQTVNWYDAVKWCNARSEMEGRPAVYRVDGTVYRTGMADDVVQTFAAGYRLPTSGEWEVAARGGLESKRFPWGDMIQHARANYSSSSIYSYDTSPTRGYHPTYNDGNEPYTSPVGSFAANGYGLYDMLGNVWEWCFDWDPSHEGSFRVFRGGSWGNIAIHCRVGLHFSFWPGNAGHGLGFRAVLPPGH